MYMHLEIFPAIKRKLNGVNSSGITGVEGWSGGRLVEGVPTAVRAREAFRIVRIHLVRPRIQ